MPVSHALFDVDTRIPAEDGGALRISPRAEPIRAPLERLFAWAEREALPVVATTCLQAAPIEGVLGASDVLVTPADESAGKVTAATRRIFLGRTGCGDAEIHVRDRCYDVFHNNPNAAATCRAVGAAEWVVFGVSLEYCVRSAAEGLLRLGETVTLLEDVLLPSSRSAPGSREQTLEDLASAGARVESMGDFFARVGAHA